MTHIDNIYLENALLKRALSTTLWMASEYAKRNQLFAPYMFNRALDIAIKCNVPLKGELYVTDRLLGVWNPNIGYFDIPYYDEDCDCSICAEERNDRRKFDSDNNSKAMINCSVKSRKGCIANHGSKINSSTRSRQDRISYGSLGPRAKVDNSVRSRTKVDNSVKSRTKVDNSVRSKNKYKSNNNNSLIGLSTTSMSGLAKPLNTAMAPLRQENSEINFERSSDSPKLLLSDLGPAKLLLSEFGSSKIKDIITGSSKSKSNNIEKTSKRSRKQNITSDSRDDKDVSYRDSDKR